MQNAFQSLDGFQSTAAVNHKSCILCKCREKVLVEIGNTRIVKCKMIDMGIILHKFCKTFNTAHPIEENAITLKPALIDLYNPQERLSFYVTLAHELCHANQKKEGLYYNDLSEASFGDTFRVAKMMETETRLLSATIENELLKRKEFQGCIPSIDCLYSIASCLQYVSHELSSSKSGVISYCLW